MQIAQAKDTTERVVENIEKGIDYIDAIERLVLDHAPGILLAILVFFIGSHIAKLIRRIAVRVMERGNYDPTVISFTSQVVYYVIISFVIFTALSMAGVPTTSFLAAFGAIGLAVGLALQNNLSNFASGLLILIFKPFKAGDWISVNGVEGSVRSIQFLNTTVVTKENRIVFIPNSKITNDNLTNSHYETTRYITFIFDISYDNDHHKAIAILKDIFKGNEKVLNSDTMEIGIREFGESSVRIVAFPLVETVNFHSVYYGTMSDVKDRFDEAGISIPYPQRVVHVQQGEPVKEKPVVLQYTEDEEDTNSPI